MPLGDPRKGSGCRLVLLSMTATFRRPAAYGLWSAMDIACCLWSAIHPAAYQLWTPAADGHLLYDKLWTSPAAYGQLLVLLPMVSYGHPLPPMVSYSKEAVLSYVLLPMVSSEHLQRCRIEALPAFGRSGFVCVLRGSWLCVSLFF